MPRPELRDRFGERFDRLLVRVAQPSVVLRVAALAICVLEVFAAVGALLGFRTDAYDGLVPALYQRLGGAPSDRALLLACLALVLTFAWACWRLTRDGSADQPPHHALARILTVDLLAVCVTPGLPFLVTALAAVLLRVREAFLFALFQVALNVGLYALLPSADAPAAGVDLPGWFDKLSLLVSMAALHGLAFGLGRMAAAEAEKRRWLQVMLAERVSAEQLLAEQLRYAERLALAREFHDVFGHHLTALNLQLQLGSALLQREDATSAAQAVERAREGAARLLDDVREAVSAQRSSRRIDLSAALEALASGVESTRVELAVADAARDLSPRVAHALLRCVQEAVTNAVRHARATRVHVALEVDRGGLVHLRIEDDGRGAPRYAAGNGLKGMGERMAELGGRMQVSAQGPGFRIELECPTTA
ncbi:MAG: ATP-binding protein [Pelomonas sp.]|nr:ATP-binding protein [Roseateles sp.]